MVLAPDAPGTRTMTRAEKARKIQAILGRLYPEPPIPLRHDDPFSLLVAVLLSAQTTDERVNQVTPGLFADAPTPAAMVQLGAPLIPRWNLPRSCADCAHVVAVTPTISTACIQRCFIDIMQVSGAKIALTRLIATSHIGIDPVKIFYALGNPTCLDWIVITASANSVVLADLKLQNLSIWVAKPFDSP